MTTVMEPPQDVQKNLATPSPSTSAHTSSSSSRRPPRKSTLTQQQKNQKRQRATQDQLITLEVEFNKNPTPTAIVRERIAQDISMTERSVQIWFQNRRAKIKNIAKRSIESGEEIDSIPDSMRQYLAMQAYGPGKALPGSLLGRTGGLAPYGNGTLCLNTDTSTGKTVIQHFACRSLSIGTWRRVGQTSMDLVIFYSPEEACITYYINNDSAGYKIEYSFAWIKNITLEQGDVLSAAEGASQRPGGLMVELTRPPKFYMDSAGSGGFYECGDFTEDQQAGKIMTHHLGGHSKVLAGQLAKLASLDAYQNRHNTFDPIHFAVSAPVSPVGPRPASQPNHMLNPHSHMNIFQDNTIGLMGPPGPRGHKRQRSRSVPVAIDFSMLRHPMPSFLIQHDQQHAQAPQLMQDPDIFAPVPQHQHPHGFAPGTVGPSLSIDTSAGYGMDFRQFNGPMSATTANSPSDFGTPAFFTSGPISEAMPINHFNPPFSNHFLSIDAGAMIGTSNTPLSIVSHGDPIIADHSPPLTGMGRSLSADMFGTPGEHPTFSDDGMYLSESFNKQMNLPLRSPLSEQPYRSPLPDQHFDFRSPIAGQEQHMNMPFRGPEGVMNFQSPPQQDGNMTYQSPLQQNQHAHDTQQQLHQDSGVSFDSPCYMPQEQNPMFQIPKDSGMLYQDAKMYQSPSQMHQQPHEPNMYQQSSLNSGTTTGEELDMHHLVMYGTIDPTNLGQHHQTNV